MGQAQKPYLNQSKKKKKATSPFQWISNASYKIGIVDIHAY